MIKMFSCGPIETNAVVVYSEKTSAAVYIDPAAGSLEVVEDFVKEKGLKVEKILLTHTHWDHIADCKRAKEKFDAPVYVHQEDAKNLEEPGSDGLPCPLEIPGVKPTGFLNEGDIIEVGELKLEVIHTPGHSPGSVSFYIAREHAMICGDFLFQGGMGTMAVPTAEPKRMQASLSRMQSMPGETVLYPGHWGTTTLANEQRSIKWEY